MKTILSLFCALALVATLPTPAHASYLSATWACCDAATGACSYAAKVQNPNATQLPPFCGFPSPSAPVFAVQMQTAAGSLSVHAQPPGTPLGLCFAPDTPAHDPASQCTMGSGTCPLGSSATCYAFTASGGAAAASGDAWAYFDPSYPGVASLMDVPAFASAPSALWWAETDNGTYYVDGGSTGAQALLIDPATGTRRTVTAFETRQAAPPDVPLSSACDTCASIAASCGVYSVSQACGGTLVCGNPQGPQTGPAIGCVGAGQECNYSSRSCCTPQVTCSSQHKMCGSFTDDCGVVQFCHGCAAGQTCSADTLSCLAQASPPNVPALPAAQAGALGFLLAGLGLVLRRA